MERVLGARPICGRCGKPVDRMTEDVDVFMERRRFRAYCHGQVESVVMTDQELQSIAGVSWGVAFAAPPVLAPRI